MPKASMSIILTISMTAISLCFLTKYMIDQSQHLSESNNLKLSCLLLEHFFIIYMISQLVHCQSTDDYVNWIIMLSSVIFVSVTITEVIDKILNKKFLLLRIFKLRNNPVDRMYLSLWLNIYFETWLYSFTCLAIVSCTLGFTKISDYCKNRRKQVFLNNVLKKVQLRNMREEEKECSICLLDYEENESIVMGTCEHKYHEECLLQWLQEQNNCPMCREVFY